MRCLLCFIPHGRVATVVMWDHAEHEKIDMVISSLPGLWRVRRSRERVRGIIQNLKALLHCLLHTPHFVRGYNIACLWQGSTLTLNF